MTDVPSTKRGASSPINVSTRVYVAIFGILAGLGGVLHGIAEIAQGNKPPADILPRIGAFTIVPNYLVTGICATVVAIALVAWSVTRVQRKWGPTIYLALSLVLALVGGGVALVPFSILAWAVATRIRKPLLWWKRALSIRVRTVLSNLWLVTLLFGSGLFIVGFGIWSLVLPPGEIREVTPVHYACWSFLSSGALILVAALICGFAHDLERAAEET